MVAHARLSDGHVPGSMLSGLALKLKKGLPAPEFTLPTIRDHGGISLSSFLGRPVVLVFGSFSCSVFHDRISQINEFYRANRDRAAFLFVSVTEAGHRIPGLEFVLDSIDPDTLENRRERVGEAMRRMGLSFPGVLDIGETAEAAYDAYPTRLVVVGPDGRIALDLGRGMPPETWDFAEAEACLRGSGKGLEPHPRGAASP